MVNPVSVVYLATQQLVSVYQAHKDVRISSFFSMQKKTMFSLAAGPPGSSGAPGFQGVAGMKGDKGDRGEFDL